MNWKNGQLAEAAVKSNIGGKLRLRSYVPLKGEGLTPAEGESGNPLLTPARMKDAEVSGETIPEYPVLYRIYEYDIETLPGQTYKFSRAI